MARLITIDLDDMRPSDVWKVRSVWRDLAKREGYVMTIREAAEFYGYEYHTLRSYVKSGRLRTSGKSKATGKAGLTHKTMRAYLQGLKATSQRKAFRRAQMEIGNAVARGERNAEKNQPATSN